MLRNNRTHARTCGDCRFMTERMGVLRTHCECLEPSQSGRRVGEKDAACPLFAGHMVKPGPSLAELLGADTRRAVGELTSEKPARTGRRGTGTTGAAAAGAPATADADATIAVPAADEADLAALEARAQAAEARAQALEAKAALAEARARASRGERASGR